VISTVWTVIAELAPKGGVLRFVLAVLAVVSALLIYLADVIFGAPDDG
jgi:hypothetical protein